MFLMTSSPLQATEATAAAEFSDLTPVTPVGSLLFVSGWNVSFDTYKSSKDNKQKRVCVCMCVCESRRQKSYTGKIVVEKNDRNFPLMCSTWRHQQPWM